MGIYTKTGDQGQTSLFDGSRVDKFALRVETYGTIDECNAQISLAEKVVKSKKNKQILIKVQHQLFQLSAEVATENTEKLVAKSSLIAQEQITYLENIIDAYTLSLPKVNQFILPGKSVAGAQLHIARTVCRRSERHLVHLKKTEEISSNLVKYLNRLSDCLYILARSEDYEEFQEVLIEKVMTRYIEKISKKTSERENDWFSAERLYQMQELVNHQAASLNVQLTVVIVDDAGHVRYTYRMAEALLVSLDVATKKAYTAVAMKMATEELQQQIQPSEELYPLGVGLGDKLLALPGGQPLFSRGKLIGGIGISGGSLGEDVAIGKVVVKWFEEEALQHVGTKSIGRKN